MTELLKGVTVLDFAQGMAGSVATMVLSDFGAEVIKIEPPEGDPYRSIQSSLLWNRGKKSVVLDLSTDDGRASARALAESADILVETFEPGEADAVGIGYRALSAVNPGLVYTSITGFGAEGPYAQYPPYEPLIAAKCGRFALFAGQNDREGPNYAAVQVGSHAAGMAAVRGSIAALMLREKTGRGQHVETSLLRAITYYDLAQWAIWQMMIKFPEDFPDDPTVVTSRPTPLQYLPVRTKDGRWVQLANLMERLFIAEVKAIGLGHMLDEPRYANAPNLDSEAKEEMREAILARMQELTLDEWMDLFVNVEGDVAAEPFLTCTEAFDHPQMVHNGAVQTVDDPTVGPMRQLGPLFKMDGTPGAVPGPAPLVGQHTDEVLARLGCPAESDSSEVAPACDSAPTSYAKFPHHPLEGVTVLDMSTVIAGPLTGSLLAELGARVIRIETLAGDWMRAPYKGFFTNRTMAGTEGLSIDLKTADGQEVLGRLLPGVDVVLHNMRPGAPERVGIGLNRVRELNPDAVYAYLGGYGSSGPYSHRPAMHPIGGAVAGGVLAQVGPDLIPPAEAPMEMAELIEVSRKLGRANEVNPDPNTAMVTATAITMALYGRQRFQTPQYVETTMIGANAYTNADDFFDFEGRLPRSAVDPDGFGRGALHRLYEASDGWVFLCCLFDREWESLCETIGRADLLDNPRYGTSKLRTENDGALAAELSAVFSGKGALEWEGLLTSAGVGCVQTEDRGMYFFFSDDPHVQASRLTTEVSHPRFGTFWRYVPILEFSETQCVAGPGIMRGQHTIPILAELGYSKEEVHGLRARGVLDWEEL